MFYDLNVPWPVRPPIVTTSNSTNASKKAAKGKQKETTVEKRGAEVVSPAELAELERCVQMAIKRE